MVNALYTIKTSTNQALTPRPWGNRITLPVLLPVLLVTLLILSACGGGGAAPTTATPTPPATCATNPFGDACTSEADKARQDVIIRRCIMVGNAGNDDCKNAIAKNPCIATPFLPECSSRNSTFAPYVVTAQMQRRGFCEISTNAANKLCVTSVANICTGDIFDTICPSSTLEERQDFCRRGNNLNINPNCADIAAPICASNPLFEALCTPDVVRQRMYCRTGTNAMTDMNCKAVIVGICTENAFDGICDADDTEGQAAFCGRGNNFVTYASNCTAILDTYCATRAFLPSCDSQTETRIQACSGSIAALRTAGGEASDCVDYADRICGRGQLGGSNPFAPICADADVSDYSATINTVRDSFCANDVFNPLCDGYIDQRVAACHLNGVPTNADPRCPAIIAQQCPSSGGTRRSTCHIAVAAASIARTTDPITFYVEGTADALKLGFTQSNVPANISDFSSGVIRLSDLTDVDSPEGDNDGVGFASFTDSNGDNSEGQHRQQKFYAGLLTGDTLTTRVSENLKNAKWPAKLAIYNEVNLLCLGNELGEGMPHMANLNCNTAPNDGRVVEPAEFILLVSFDGSNGTIRADGIPVIGDYQFAIDAGFNDAGKIFGNTRLSVVRMSAPGLFPVTLLTEASDGTITGKIGQKGLLAAFVSDGVNNRLGEYAGGLVAHNPHNGASAPDCTATGTPFHGRCVDNNNVRIMLCSTRNALATADLTNNCLQDSDIVAAICASSGTYANPFDGVICANPQALVQQAFLANCDPGANISLRAGADCAGVLACTENPFSSTCNTGDTAEIYASARVAHLEYCRSSVAVAGTDKCLLAVVNCASSSPHANCGDLPTSYCLGDAGRTIAEDTSDCNTRVTARCRINPLNLLCGDDTINAAFINGANLKLDRENFCLRPINANNPDCALTIVVFCDDASNAISSPLCRNRVHYRYNVIASVCDNPNRDARFNKLCDTPHAYDITRLEHCKTVDFKLAGCGVTVSEERQVMLEITCGDDAGLRGTNPNDPICTHHQKDPNGNLRICGSYNRAGTNPMSPICEIEPQALITVAALCGQGFKGRTIGTIGINPFSAICADDLFNPAPCPSCTTDLERTNANTNAWTEAQRAFCRQDITNNACTSTITTYCDDATGADLFDNLCNGNDYLADRVTHCETAFTHAKCTENQMNISDAAAICGTTSVPGTDPFNAVCKNETLNPIACPSCEAISDAKDKATELARIRIIVIRATQQAFCRATANVGESICADTISSFCSVPTDSDMIFDDLCGGADYTGARLAYCIHPTRSVHHDCETASDNKAALMTLCGDAETAGTNPFSVACREAFALRNSIDIVCGGGRNSQLPLCTDENAIPDIDRASVTASQENFCRGNLANTACEETIADFCDFAFDTDVLDPLCSGDERYENSRLITCLNGDTNHASCRGAAGVVATLCPTDGMPRHEDCPIIVDHALYRTSVDEFDEIDENSANFIRPSDYFSRSILALAGVKDKAKDGLSDVERAIGYVTDARANLIRGTGSQLDFGTIPATDTVIRNGGNPLKIRVRITQQDVNADTYRIAGTNYGYALAHATVTAQDTITNAFISSERKLYAGLLSYSGFSAPNFDNPTVGIWNATMNLRGLGGATASADFDLSVDFISQRITTHATRLAEFTLASASFQERQFTPIDSHVFELRNPFTLKTFYQRNSRGEDIIVTSRDTYTDCNGNVLLQGSKVPLCKGGGSPDYLTSSYGILRLDVNGNPRFITETKQTSGRLTIDASFSRLGLIHGGINIETGVLNDDGNLIGKNGGDVTSNPGTLVGRISTDQLFAAFASNAGSAEAYAGGFIATPSATLSPTRFTTGGTDKLTLAGKTEAAAPTSQIRHPLGITSNEDYVIDSTTNGFALASENIANDGINLYAGILSGTDLGNPLFDNSATGIWRAKLNLLILGDTASADFDLNVDFNTRTIETLANRPAQFTFDKENKVLNRLGEDAITVANNGVATVNALDAEGNPVTFVSSASGVVVTMETLTEVLTIDDDPGLPLLTDTYQSGDRRTVSVTETEDTSVSNRVTRTKVVVLKAGGTLTITTAYSTSGGTEQLLSQIAQTTREIPVVRVTEGAVVTTYRAGQLVEVSTSGAPAVNPLTKAPKATGRLTVNGRFSETGKISGTTNLQPGQNDLAPGVSGTLTGLIGEAGLVAAFISDPDNPNAYAGGFTATPWVCTAGGTPFDKTNCPDANIGAKALRLQLCLDRDPAAMADFATNCAGDATITALVCTGTGTYANPFDADICPTADDNVKTTFVDECFADAGQANACTTGQVARCLHDPYAFVCKSSMYEQARTAHLDTCGVATSPPNPRCTNLRAQLNSCSVAQPDPSCGTLVNDYCLGGAGRAIAGKTTCVENIRVACTANALHPRCRDLGVFPTEIAHVAHINKQRDFCEGDLTNLPTGAKVSDCNTLGITVQICGSPTAVGTNPFATICSNAMGNPYSEARELKIIQTFFCQQGAQGVNNDCNTLQQQLDSEFAQIGGKTPYWADNAIREVAAPDLDENGNIQIISGRHTDTKLVQFPINITPAGKIRRDSADANYIVGGTTQLDLASLIERDRNGVEIDHTPVTDGIANRGGLSLNTPFTNSADLKTSTDAASGFAFASVEFPVRTLVVKVLDDGSEFRTIARTATRRYGGIKLYTGLLAGTDVGAPVSDIQTEVEWTGKISALYGVGKLGETRGERNIDVVKYDDKEFTLLVSFYGNFGSIRNKDLIVLSSAARFNIDGRFNDKGLIYGKTRLFDKEDLIASGSLTGLIGADGAVATFVSDDENPSPPGPDGCCPIHFGNYAGGFVALPPATPSTAPRVDFETWLDSFDAPNTPLTRAIRPQDFTSGNDKQYFVQGTFSALDRANDNYGTEKDNHWAETRVKGNPVRTLTLDKAFNDGNIYDGIAYLRGTGRRAYVGILSGTVLGAPVTGVADTTARWAGRFRDNFYATSANNLSVFELIVRFTAQGGTLDGIVTRDDDTLGVGIDGAFDAKGIITGDVIHGNTTITPATTNVPIMGSCFTNGLPTITEDCFTDDTDRIKATLTGLIGEEGAVGAFIGQSGTFPEQLGWVGGFVATPDFCGNTSGTANDPQCNTNRDDWVGSFGNDAPPVTVTAAAQTGVFGGFLDIASGAAIAADGLKTAPNGDTASVSGLRGRNTEHNNDGFIFISGYNGANHQAFVGIRPTTNLGAPLTVRPTIAAWSGSYYDSIAAVSTNATFDIDFSNRSISASGIANTVTNPPTFNLGFNNVGVITGTVTKNSIEATARGLIGQQGLVGVFVDTSPAAGPVFHGGFVADNPVNGQ